VCAAGARRIACDMGWKPAGRRRGTLPVRFGTDGRLRSQQPGRRRRVAGTSRADASRNLRNETGDVEPALPVRRLIDVLFPKSTGPGPPVPPDTPRIGATFCFESWLFHGRKKREQVVLRFARDLS
jgi:hypothetical protein